MRLTLVGCFDAGLSIGIDDYEFTAEKVQSFERRLGNAQTRMLAKELPTGLAVPMGAGLRVDVLNHPLVKGWCGRAEVIAREGHKDLAHWKERDTPMVVDKTLALFAATKVSSCSTFTVH